VGRFVPDQQQPTGRFVPDAAPNAPKPFSGPLQRETPTPYETMKTLALNNARGMLGDIPVGAAEAATEYATGMVTTPINEFAAGIRGAMGKDDSGTVIDPYKPETPVGQAASKGVSTLMSPVSAAIDWSADTDNPDPKVRATGHLAKGLLGLVGLKGLGRGGSRPLHPAVENARSLKLSLDPRQVVEGKPLGTPVQRAAAVVGGKAAIPADASLLNQARVRELVAEDLGLPPTESITPATIARLRAPANAAYKAVEDLKNAAGQPMRVNVARDGQYLGAIRKLGQDAVSGVSQTSIPAIARLVRRYQQPANAVEVRAVLKDVQDLRFDASKHFKSDDPALVRQARTERGIADALEDVLDRQVATRHPQVIDEWRAARTQLAKLHTIEDALVGTEIDARLLAKAEDSGAKLSGNTQRLADAARNFPNVMQTGANLGSKSGLGLLDATTISAGATVGGLMGGVPGAMIGAVAWPTARYTGKRMALSPGAGVRLPRPADPARLAGSGVLSADEQRRRLMSERLQGSR